MINACCFLRSRTRKSFHFPVFQGLNIFSLIHTETLFLSRNFKFWLNNFCFTMFVVFSCFCILIPCLVLPPVCDGSGKMFSFFSVLSMMEINKINYLWDSEFFRWGGDPAGSDWDNDVWVLHHIMWISFIFHHTNLRILHKHNCNAVGVRCQAILAVCSVKSFYVKSLRA